jgi:hypothetical protein
MTLLPTLAHLMGTSPHVADILLYGGASLGVTGGLGLFFWGRHTRQSQPADQPPARQSSQQAPLPLTKSQRNSGSPTA